MSKLASWLIAAGLAVTAAGAAYPQAAPARFDYQVREDMFRGFFAGDKEAFARAMALCQARLAENPNHAEAHYQLGMALVNEGNLAGAATEFETYLKLAPEGPNAQQAKALVAQLKK